MKRLAALAFVLFCGAAAQAAAPSCIPASPRETARQDTLTPFASEDELASVIKCLTDQARQRHEEKRQRRAAQPENAQPPMAAPSAADATAAVAFKSASSAESVTNTQTAGVDEGDIVKVHGRHLVILRRGRLFTVDIDQHRLTPVAAVDAFGPEVDPGGTWYDEMLVGGNTIVVIGYSYQRGGTEVGLFTIDDDGRLTYRATYHLRSNDYYSSRNYASRLIGDKLIFYTPLYINWFASDPYAAFPAVRRWHKGALPAEFKRVAPATRIYRTDDAFEDDYGATLHTVTICDLAKPEMDCQATSLMGPPGRVFYVSAGSVYVWATRYSYGPKKATPVSSLFRIPLDGGAPTALKTAGAPIDQFSFLESADGYLNVLVRAQGQGDAMWAGEGGRGNTALLRVELSRLTDGRDSAPADAYRPLPNPEGYTLQNRFIGNYLLYGSGSSWGRPVGESRNLYVTRWDRPEPAQALRLPHSIDRIEALGENAVAVGTLDNDLLFSSIRLGGKPGFASLYSRKNAAQGETRSHGFFYKPDNDGEGLLGLPIVGGGRAGYRQLQENSAAVLYLRNTQLKLTELGALDARPGVGSNDGCRASCIDWYGNARPLFLRNRVFALLGYELVEGRIADGDIKEVRRVDFSPKGSGKAAR